MKNGGVEEKQLMSWGLVSEAPGESSNQHAPFSSVFFPSPFLLLT